jgi:hypothetical protein
MAFTLLEKDKKILNGEITLKIEKGQNTIYNAFRFRGKMSDTKKKILDF